MAFFIPILILLDMSSSYILNLLSLFSFIRIVSLINILCNFSRLWVKLYWLESDCEYSYMIIDLSMICLNIGQFMPSLDGYLSSLQFSRNIVVYISLCTFTHFYASQLNCVVGICSSY